MLAAHTPPLLSPYRVFATPLMRQPPAAAASPVRMTLSFCRDTPPSRIDATLFATLPPAAITPRLIAAFEPRLAFIFRHEFIFIFFMFEMTSMPPIFSFRVGTRAFPSVAAHLL